MSVISIVTTARKPGPYPRCRPCARCDAHLRTDHLGPLCEPCEGALPAATVQRLTEMQRVTPALRRWLHKDREAKLGAAA